MRSKRVRDVALTLQEEQIQFAVIGAAALSVHGFSRATVDFDLLAADARIFRPETWQRLRNGGVFVDIRRAHDFDDPLEGVVRVGPDSKRPVDIVMPRGDWNADVIHRAIEFGPKFPVYSSELPVVTLTDLIALKLDAGGRGDLQDIDRLLDVHRSEEARIRLEVESLAQAISQEMREKWLRFQRARDSVPGP